MHTKAQDQRIERQEDGREVFACEIVVEDSDGNVVKRGQYRRHLAGAEIDEGYLQSQVDERKREMEREAKNRARIDPTNIT